MRVHRIKIKYMLLAFLFMGFNMLTAQIEVAEENGVSLVNTVGLQNLQTVSQVQANETQQNTNSIYIQQMGSNNTSTVNTQTDYIKISLVQNGDANSSTIQLGAKTLTHNVVQNGDNNFIQEYGNNTSLNLNRNIIQNGDNQGVVIFGSNSLTEDMKLNVQGNSKTITIRNFN